MLLSCSITEATHFRSSVSLAKECKCCSFAHFYPSFCHRVWAVGQMLRKMANKGGMAQSLWETGWWYLKWEWRTGSNTASWLVEEEQGQWGAGHENTVSGNHPASRERVLWQVGKKGDRRERSLGAYAAEVRLKAAVLGDRHKGGPGWPQRCGGCWPPAFMLCRAVRGRLRDDVRVGCFVSIRPKTRHARQS